MARNVEILCIGTELLLGQIVNTNAAWLAAECARLGMAHYYQTVVGDNPERIKAALAIARQRSGIVVTTGGLGPTADDLTHAVLAEFFGVPLVSHPEVLVQIEALFKERGRRMSPTNAKQALLPEGATVLANPTGTAPGILWQPELGLTVLTFPGIPAEMKVMWTQTAVPYLRSLGWGGEIFFSRILRHWGISESGLAERVGPYLALENPTVAPYASQGEVQLRITARASDSETAGHLIEPVERELRAIAGEDYFGADGDSLASVVGAHLARRKQTLAVAESCTGGLLSGMITAVPGSSRYFTGGVTAYGNGPKQTLLGVSEDLLVTWGAVSAAVAEAMATGVRALFDSDWGLAATGIAGPDGGTELKPVGLVYIALAGPEGIESREYRFGSRRERESVRALSASTALDLLRRRVSR